MLTFYIVSVPSEVGAENLNSLSQQILTISGQREALQLQVDGFNAQINFLKDQIAQGDKQIAENSIMIVETEKRLKAEQLVLSGYLSELYQENQTSFFEKLFNSTSLSEFMSQEQYLATIRDNISKSVIEINAQKSSLENAKKQIGELQVQNALSKASLEKQLAERQTELDKATAEEQRVRGIFAVKLSKLAPGSFCKDTGKPVIKAKTPIFNFPTDCGYISQGFGNTEFASVEKVYGGKIHNGVDIGIPTGTPFRSIGNGNVFAKGVTPSGGWGNWVIIKHDPVKVNRQDVVFYSLYSHMVTETALKVGEKVNTQTVVGFVGGTPYWAPHLHFSLFLNDSGWKDGVTGSYPGNVVDPLDYMNIPISTSGTDWDPAFLHI